MQCFQSKLSFITGPEVEESEAVVSTPQDTERVHVAVTHLGLELAHAYVVRQRSHVHRPSKLHAPTSPATSASTARVF